MRKLICVGLLAALVSLPLWAQGSLKPHQDGSRIGFSLRHLTGRAEGVFEIYDGKLDFVEKKPEQSKVSFEIDVASVNTENTKRDDHLRGSDYFHAKKFPKMTFHSERFNPVGDNRFMVTGPLTIKGHTKTVSFPVTLDRKTQLWATGQDALTFKINFTLDRTEFGVGESSSLLGSEVTVDILMEFRNRG